MVSAICKHLKTRCLSLGLTASPSANDDRSAISRLVVSVGCPNQPVGRRCGYWIEGSAFCLTFVILLIPKRRATPQTFHWNGLQMALAVHIPECDRKMVAASSGEAISIGRMTNAEN